MLLASWTSIEGRLGRLCIEGKVGYGGCARLSLLTRIGRKGKWIEKKKGDSTLM